MIHDKAYARAKSWSKALRKYNIDKDIIYATALLHDTGRIEQYNDNIPHNLASVKIAQSILSDCRYSDSEIEEICVAICKHRKKTQVRSRLTELLFSADKLSRLCFECKAEKECYWDKELKNNNIIY